MHSEQKFHHGDLIQLDKNFTVGMNHFPGKGQRAIVIGSYADKFGGHDTTSYELIIEGIGRNSWYPEILMTLIKKNQQKLMYVWEMKRRMLQ